MPQVLYRGLMAALLLNLSAACSGPRSSDGGDEDPPPTEEPDVVPPGQPLEVQAWPEIRAASVTWRAPRSDGGGAIVKYTVTASPGGITATTTGATQVEVPGLANGTRYTFTVRATNASGDGPESEASSPVTTPDVPGAPRIVDVIPRNTELTVTWEPPASEGGDRVHSYFIELLAGSYQRSVQAAGSSGVVTGLSPDTEYQVVVRAVNGVGMGPPSAPHAARTRCDRIGLATPIHVPMGATLRGLAAGDFDGDGKMDLAGTRMSESAVATFLGAGDASFLKKGDFQVGADPEMVLTEDFNGDGALDLAVLNTRGQTVSVLLGLGDGAFEPARTTLTGAGPWSMTTADFDGDGNRDLFTVNTSLSTGASTLSWLQGNGRGSFTRRDFSLPFAALSVASADFDGDGHVDVALPASLGYDFYIYMGAGDGSFREGYRYSAQNSPRQVAAADLNNDGKSDLLVTSRGDTFNSPSVSVYLGRGDGTFEAVKRHAVTGEVGALTVADLNADGWLDVAVTVTAENTVSLLLGLGDGSLSARHDVALVGVPRGLVAGRFTANGRPALMVSQDGDDALTQLTTACLP
ncbi:FG-GAP-like repeat-containing protein [Myxococcus sp. Y35]|uniref:FG-GAP-like repeat-containing protein n=1 Tax=Pseudomyxococcus flavus TaxID=3115648 RepID=UPI003CEFE6F6